VSERLKIVHCPNPDCDPEGGCCICDHTGYIYEYVLDEMLVAEDKEPS